MKNRTKLISLWGIGPTFIFPTAYRGALGPGKVAGRLQGQYSVIYPDDYGQRWNFQLQVTPVIPNLIPNVLFK